MACIDLAGLARLCCHIGVEGYGRGGILNHSDMGGYIVGCLRYSCITQRSSKDFVF